ncbi:MAG: cytochrome c biogenesis protein ResB [Bacteroidetes bacterium]|nr:cytochrome c biogenesis protein ResB [Bacteroidota bacterium]MBU1720066.1 cytochrome c biogenesis protein ResB [Bacteroidota bacterium]
MTKNNKPYQFSFAIIALIFMLGLIMEFLFAETRINLEFPINLYVLIAFVNILFFSYYFLRENKIVKWLSSVPAAVAAISLFAALSLIMGFVPQEETGTGFYNITSSWMYLFSLLFLLLVLGMVTMKRLIPFRLKNVGFLLNHVGLWIALACGSLGASDVISLKMPLNEGEVSWKAYNTKGEVFELPVAIKLNDFSMELYPAKIVLVNKQDSKIVGKGKKYDFVSSEPGKNGSLSNYQIDVIEALEDAVYFEGVFREVHHPGSAPAAKISVTGEGFDSSVTGWISSGSYNQMAMNLDLGNGFFVGMTDPEPAKFASDVFVYTKDGKTETAIIEVNKPYSINHWKIYQSSYNEQMGKWSTESVVELVRDRWLPWVYIGIYLMLAGAIVIFWKGAKR